MVASDDAVDGRKVLKRYAEMGWEKEGRPRVSGVWIYDLRDEEFLAARTILGLSTIF